MRSLVLILLLAISVLIGSCTENNTNEVIGYEKTLVVITDEEPTSPLMLDIKGDMKKNYPEVEVEIVKTKDFDIFQAGYLLNEMADSYPEDTYFAVVVDPGVHTKFVAYKVDERIVLAPDNGSTTQMRREFTPQTIYYIDNTENFDGSFENVNEMPFDSFYRQAILNMFKGIPVSNFGSVCTEPVELEIQDAEEKDGSVIGQIFFVDNFGNCETNIPATLMESYEVGDLIEVSYGENKFIAKLGTSYSSVGQDENVAFVNSKNPLEIAVNLGNLSERYGISAGTKIEVRHAVIRVGIIRYNSSDLVDNIIEGMKSEMADAGFIDNKNVVYTEINAGGDNKNFGNLISGMLSNGIDIAVPVSTPAAQAALQYIPASIPVVYTYVTSPEFAGLIGKRSNVAGLSDATNFEDYLSFAKELVPNLENPGRIYNPSEPNSAFSQQQFTSLAGFYGLTYNIETVSGVDEIPAAFNSLNSQSINTILIAADNTLNLGMKSLADLAKENDVKLIGDSDANIVDGALASISVDYDMLAKATGTTVTSVVLGVDPDSKDIQRFPTSVIGLNKVTAAAIGYEFPQSVINKASKIIE